MSRLSANATTLAWFLCATENASLIKTSPRVANESASVERFSVSPLNNLTFSNNMPSPSLSSREVFSSSVKSNDLVNVINGRFFVT